MRKINDAASHNFCGFWHEIPGGTTAAEDLDACILMSALQLPLFHHEVVSDQTAKFTETVNKSPLSLSLSLSQLIIEPYSIFTTTQNSGPFYRPTTITVSLRLFVRSTPWATPAVRLAGRTDGSPNYVMRKPSAS